jgi:YVTN family beta-propeller protein
VDVLNLTANGTIPVGHAPRAVAFAPDGMSAFVTNLLDGTVSVIDTNSGTVSGNPITVGGAPVAVAISDDGATAYVANLMTNTVSVIDTATRAVDAIEGVTAPFDVALGPTCPPPDPTPTPTVGPTCVGDCDGDGQILVNELITGVNIALNNLPITSCRAFDTNGSGQVEINELITAVNNAQSGCTG